MATPMNQLTSSTTDLPRTLVEDIDQYLADGMPVYDLNGEQVGYVKTYTIAAGYLQVGTGPMSQRALYLPFRLIRSITPHDVIVCECRDVLIARYTEPPAISTVVEHRLVPRSNGATTPQTYETYEVQVVTSGYDNQPTEFNRIDLSSLTDRLAVGMVVYDVNGERLGETTRYDVPRGLMVVEKGIFKPTTLLVPFSAVREIHPGSSTVYLSVPRHVVVQEQRLLPMDA